MAATPEMMERISRFLEWHHRGRGQAILAHNLPDIIGGRREWGFDAVQEMLDKGYLSVDTGQVVELVETYRAEEEEALREKRLRAIARKKLGLPTPRPAFLYRVRAFKEGVHWGTEVSSQEHAIKRLARYWRDQKQLDVTITRATVLLWDEIPLDDAGTPAVAVPDDTPDASSGVSRTDSL